MRHLLLGSWLAAGIVAIAAVAPAVAQDTTPQFVPGKIVIYYRTTDDRDAALRDMSGASLQRMLSTRLRVQGENAAAAHVEKNPGNSLVLSVEHSSGLRSRIRTNPAQELRLLEQIARQVKMGDPKILDAMPIVLDSGINPPKPQPLPETPAPQPRSGVPDAPAAPDRATETPAGPDRTDRTRTQPLMRSSAGPASGDPNDPLYRLGLQWHYGAWPPGMNAVGAWKTTKGSRDVIVAVIDSGIAANNPDIRLRGGGLRNTLPGRNFARPQGFGPFPDEDATDPGQVCVDKFGRKHQPSWHGTHVAGTVGAGEADDGVGGVGVSWQVTILPIRVLANCSPNGQVVTWITDLLEAIRWAAGLPVDGVEPNPQPAHIINLSIGGTAPCIPAYQATVDEARRKGVILVVAAGNEAVDVKNSRPANCKGVISVAATNRKGVLSSFSNFGDVTILAPGGEADDADSVWSLIGVKGDEPYYIWGQAAPYPGTSMAAPHVAGAIALALAANPQWLEDPSKTVDIVEQKLRASMIKRALNVCPKERSCGTAGHLDAARLIQQQ